MFAEELVRQAAQLQLHERVILRNAIGTRRSHVAHTLIAHRPFHGGHHVFVEFAARQAAVLNVGGSLEWQTVEFSRCGARNECEGRSTPDQYKERVPCENANDIYVQFGHVAIVDADPSIIHEHAVDSVSAEKSGHEADDGRVLVTVDPLCVGAAHVELFSNHVHGVEG
jgi:hypothetical protein